jgi:hypothetical protein
MTKAVHVVKASSISRIYENKQTIVVDNDCVVEAVNMLLAVEAPPVIWANF